MLIWIGGAALFVVFTAYVVSTARILSRTGDIDEPPADDEDEVEHRPSADDAQRQPA
jgi:hypothetical protein